MSALNERIKEVVDTSGLTKTDFAKRINVSQPSVSMYCNGSANPSDRTISDICREFHVSEKWLRTGEGDMEPDATHRQKLNNFFTDVLATAPDERSAFVAALADLPPEFWGLVADLARNYAENLKKAD